MIRATAIYIKEVKNINEAAEFFAVRGYHVTTSFLCCDNFMEVSIFFYQIDEKKTLEDSLRRYANENDKIDFIEFIREDGTKYYTLTLNKYAL